jgi:hypothetical protein
LDGITMVSCLLNDRVFIVVIYDVTIILNPIPAV